MTAPEWAARLPEFRSHKIVRAAPILAFISREHDGGEIVRLQAPLDRSIHVAIPAEVFARKRPEVGDYIVVYDDGYMSWSPKAAFEDGYTPAAEK